MKEIRFDTGQQVCDFVNENKIKVIAISSCNKCTMWHLFYSDD